MAQDKNTKTEKKKLEEQKEKKAYKPEKLEEESLVRILGKDIIGSKKLFVGLTKIKGVGWSISNATCIKLGLNKEKRVAELTKDEIAKIEAFLKNADIKDFMKNRRRDLESGESKHYTSNDLDMKKDFDIRRLRKIRSYKGIRHTAKLPVRGQRTRSHFRKKGQPVKVRKK